MLRQPNFFSLSSRLPVLAEPHRVESPVLPHEHPYTEIALVIEGTAEHCSSLGIWPVKRGSMVIIHPGAWHSFKKDDGLILYNCYIPTDVAHHELQAFAQSPSISQLIEPYSHSIPRDNVLQATMTEGSLILCHEQLDAIYQLTNRYNGFREPYKGYQPLFPLTSHPSSDAALRLKLMGHFLFLLEEAVNTLAANDITGQNPEFPMHQAVQEAMRLLTEKPSHAWTLDELASQLYLDPSYVVRLFKKHMGLPPLSYLAHYRADLAAKLLVTTDQAISVIGAEVGWPDPVYFGKRFKLHFGVCPRTYRARFAL